MPPFLMPLPERVRWPSSRYSSQDLKHSLFPASDCCVCLGEDSLPVTGAEFALYTLPTTRKFQKRQQQHQQHCSQHHKFVSIKRRTPQQMREEQVRLTAVRRRHSEILVEELAAGQLAHLACRSSEMEANRRTEEAKNTNYREGTETNRMPGDEILYATLNKRTSRRSGERRTSRRTEFGHVRRRDSAEAAGSEAVTRTEIVMQEDFSSMVAIDKVILPLEAGAENHYEEEEEVDSECGRLKKCIYGGRDGFKILSVEVLPLEREEQRQQY